MFGENFGGSYSKLKSKTKSAFKKYSKHISKTEIDDFFMTKPNTFPKPCSVMSAVNFWPRLTMFLYYLVLIIHLGTSALQTKVAFQQTFSFWPSARFLNYLKPVGFKY